MSEYRFESPLLRGTIRKIRIVQLEGNRQVQRNIIHYNLQMIISVGLHIYMALMNYLTVWNGMSRQGSSIIGKGLWETTTNLMICKS